MCFLFLGGEGGVVVAKRGDQQKRWVLPPVPLEGFQNEVPHYSEEQLGRAGRKGLVSREMTSKPS